MKIIKMARGRGKTTKLIKLAKKQGAILLVHNYHEKSRLVEVGKLQSWQVMSYDEALGHGLKGFHNPVLIDELDSFLLRVLGLQCIGFSFTPKTPC